MRRWATTTATTADSQKIQRFILAAEAALYDHFLKVENKRGLYIEKTHPSIVKAELLSQELWLPFFGRIIAATDEQVRGDFLWSAGHLAGLRRGFWWASAGPQPRISRGL